MLLVSGGTFHAHTHTVYYPTPGQLLQLMHVMLMILGVASISWVSLK